MADQGLLEYEQDTDSNAAAAPSRNVISNYIPPARKPSLYKQNTLYVAIISNTNCTKHTTDASSQTNY